MQLRIWIKFKDQNLKQITTFAMVPHLDRSNLA
jgi:hypothetical protein